MKVIDLFAGLKGWSQAFIDRGHTVWTLDFNKRFNVDSHQDILEITPDDLPFVPDVLLASPPCTYFTVMQIGRNWNHDHTPKTSGAVQAVEIVKHTLALIELVNPRFWIMENPRAKLRKLDFMQEFELREVTYCQLGENRQKATDLWGVFPPSLKLPKPCKNGDPCHVSAPRGSTTGTQGMDSAESAKVPYQLSKLVCIAAENEIYGPNVWQSQIVDMFSFSKSVLEQMTNAGR